MLTVRVVEQFLCVTHVHNYNDHVVVAKLYRFAICSRVLLGLIKISSMY